MARYKEITLTSNATNSGNQGRLTQIYRGLSTVGSDSNNFALYDIELIKRDILNHFSIRKGEKINNPEFGSIVWNILYEPLTSNAREELVKDVQAVLESDPRINPITINVVEKDYGIQFAIELEFVNYGQTETIIYNFDRDNGLTSS